MEQKSREIYVIVHNVRSLHNVGSVFRTADAAGVSKMYITGYTPTPLDELGRVRAEIHKTALGAEQTMPWEYVKSVNALITRLHKKGVHVIALEQSNDALDYRTFKVQFPCALLIGNEVRGVSKKTLAKTDAIIQIPMRGTKESLNVSVAFGIAVYQIAHG